MERPLASRNSEERLRSSSNTDLPPSHHLPFFDSYLHDTKDDKALIPLLDIINMKRTCKEMV
jgi:hypothetical protein